MSDFANITRVPWHSRGFLASQTAYVSLALLLLIAIVSIVAPVFLTLGNISNVLTDFSYVAIVSLGSTIVIITAGIDLSVGSTLGLVATVFSLLYDPYHANLSVGWAIFGGVATGLLVGVVNGLLVTRLNVPAFIATLTMLFIGRGMILGLTAGSTIAFETR